MSLVSAQHVGAEVRRARHECGMTQVALSSAMREHGLGMDQTAISRVESGIRELEYREALALRDLIGFGVEHADLRVFTEAAAFRRIREAVEAAMDTSSDVPR